MTHQTDEQEMRALMDATLIRLEKARRNGTGCNLTADMVHALSITHLGEPMAEAFNVHHPNAKVPS